RVVGLARWRLRALRSRQGGDRALHALSGAGIGPARDHRQLHRARGHRHRADHADRAARQQHRQPEPRRAGRAAPARHRRGLRPGRRVSRDRPVRLCDRRGDPDRWRSVAALTGRRDMQLAGKVALVTGAQQGIGRGIAVAFAAAGCDVAINWLDDEAAARAVAAEVVGHGRRAVTIQADLARLDHSREMVATVVAAVGAIDILVNNAGVFPRIAFLDLEESDWDHVHDINLKGACFCAQAAARVMVAAGRGGAIINLTSGAAYRGSPRGVHYVASKGGVVSMTRQMALELAPHRIRVNAIAPGLTDTAQPRYGSSEEEIAAMAIANPLGRIAQPEDIAQAALFLASDAAGFVTGHTLHVNGGSYLY